MYAISPMKQLSKIVLKDGTEIETNANIIHASLDTGQMHGTITILIRSTEMKKIIKSQEEINEEMVDMGLAG